MKRLAKGKAERLGCEIDRHLRAGLEGRRRGKVDDASRFAFDHSGRDRSATVGEGADIKGDHLSLALGVQLRELADEPETSIVYKQVDDLAVCFKVGH